MSSPSPCGLPSGFELPFQSLSSKHSAGTWRQEVLGTEACGWQGMAERTQRRHGHDKLGR